MDLMNQNLIHLIHDAIGFFRTKFFSEGSKSLHIAEHDGDLLALAFDPISLGQDFLGEPFGKVTLDFV